MRFSSIIKQENARLTQKRVKENSGIKKSRLKLHIMRDFEILFRRVSHSNINAPPSSVKVNDALSYNRSDEKRFKNGFFRLNCRNLFERLCIREEVVINSCSNPEYCVLKL